MVYTELLNTVSLRHSRLSRSTTVANHSKPALARKPAASGTIARRIGIFSLLRERSAPAENHALRLVASKAVGRGLRLLLFFSCIPFTK